MATEALKPGFGLLTWAAEGTEAPGLWFSRRPTVPSDDSGVTIGRGYDLKERKSGEVVADMTAAGYVDSDNKTLPTLTTFSLAAHKSGATAREYIKKNKLNSFEISQEVQRDLFTLIYPRYVQTTKRICNDPMNQEDYGIVDFTTLDPAILDFFSDLTYKGDYRRQSRRLLQPFISTNDLVGLFVFMTEWELFSNVDKVRYQARMKFLAEAIADRKSKGTMPRPHEAVFPPHVARESSGKHVGHHKIPPHAGHLKHTTLLDHRQTRLQLAHLRFTSLEA